MVKLIKPIFQGLIVSINSNPNIRLWLITLVKRLGLYNWARSFSIHLSGHVVSRKRPPIEIQHLTPRARAIFNKLKVAIAQNKENH